MPQVIRNSISNNVLGIFFLNRFFNIFGGSSVKCLVPSNKYVLLTYKYVLLTYKYVLLTYKYVLLT